MVTCLRHNLTYSTFGATVFRLGSICSTLFIVPAFNPNASSEISEKNRNKELERFLIKKFDDRYLLTQTETKPSVPYHI